MRFLKCVSVSPCLCERHKTVNQNLPIKKSSVSMSGYMTQKERVISQIKHEFTDPVPIARLAFDGDVAERLDSYYGNSKWRSLVSETDHILGVSAINRDGVQVTDTSGMYTDVFGSKWRNDMRTLHLEEPVLKEPSLKTFAFPQASDFLIENWKDDILKIIEANPEKFIIVGLGYGMFVRSWTLRGYQGALADTAAEPEFYDELIETICELQLSLLDEVLALPVDGVILDGDWGDQRGIMMGPDRWRRFIKPRLAKLYDRIHAAGKYTLNHSCGNVSDVIPDLIEIGLDVLQSVQPEAMNPYELKANFGKDITFWGGLGSQKTIPFGTPEEIRGEVRRLCTEMGKGGGYVLGPAKGLQPETPTENAAAVVEAFLETLGVRIGSS